MAPCMIDGRGVVAVLLREQLEGEVERKRVGERAQVDDRNGNIGLRGARGFLAGDAAATEPRNALLTRTCMLEMGPMGMEL